MSLADQRRKKKKTQKMSPTMKVGLFVIFVVFLVWYVIEGGNDSWYSKPTQESADNGIIETVKEKEEIPVVITPKESEKETEVEKEEPEVEQVEENPNPEVTIPTMEEVLNDSFDYNMDVSTLDNSDKYWSFKRNSEHTPVVGYPMGVDIKAYDSMYRVETDNKAVYLTFDEGYEQGYTETILDILSKESVQAAFFVTEYYIRQNPDLVKRMKDDGHIVGNHTVNHYDGVSGDGTLFTAISDQEVVDEIKGVEKAMLEETGYMMDLFFRPPGGKFNDRTLYLTRQQGYRTVFWSLAYQDWYLTAQPGKEAAYEHVMTNYHPGQIMLLHAVSESNTEALPDIIRDLKAEGYRFGSLYEVPSGF